MHQVEGTGFEMGTVITEAWLVLNLLLGLPLFKLILDHISGKPLASVTLVDLIYKDTLVLTFLLVSVASAALLHCLQAEDQTLALNWAGFYSGLAMFFMCSATANLTFSGGQPRSFLNFCASAKHSFFGKQ